MSNDAIDYINRDLDGIKKDIGLLNKLVMTGNGKPALLTQVVELSNRVEQVETTLSHDISDLKRSIDGFQRVASEKNKLAWHFKTAIIVALIGSFTSIFLNWQTSQSAAKAADIDTLTAEHLRSEQALSQKIDRLLADKK